MTEFKTTRPIHRHYFCQPRIGIYALYLYRNEIEYDINYELWRTSQSREMQSQSLDNFELSENDSDWLSRHIETAISNFRQSVAWATRGSDHTRQTTNESLGSRDSYQVVLSLHEPDWQGSVEHVCNCLHNYIVNYCLADFYRISNMPSESSVTDAEARTWLRKAHHEVDSYMPQRPIFQL